MVLSKDGSTGRPATRQVRVDRIMRHERRRGRRIVLVLAFCVVTVALAAVAIGPVPINPATVTAVLGHHLLGLPYGAWPASTEQIVWATRAPRVAMALVAGAVLAVAGAILQALVRNGLADPYLLGLNSGASTGVALVVLVVGSGSALVFSGAALAGAVGAILLVTLLAGMASRRGPLRLILAGLAVGYALNAGSRRRREGIMVPHVDSASDADRAVSAVRFPPRGTRGVGSTSRAGAWGAVSRRDYLRYGNEEVVLIAQVESAAAARTAGEIAATDGVDAVLIGAADLSTSEGTDESDPAVITMIGEAVRAIRAAGVPAGWAGGTAAGTARAAAEAGYAFCLIGNDAGMLREAATSALSTARSEADTAG